MDKLFNEIIQEVAYQLPGKDIKNARLISRSLNQAVEPVLWDTLPVTVHLNGPTLRKQMTMLNDLKNGCQASVRIRKLKIKSLAPHDQSHHFLTSQRGPSHEAEDMEEVKETLEMLPDVLPGALCALKGLISVQWNIDMEDLSSTSRVTESLASLPLLADLKVESSLLGSIPTLPLQKFCHAKLKRLYISGAVYDSEGVFTSALSLLLLHNPDLVELRLHNEHSRSPLNFHSLLDQIPADKLRLRSLYLEGWMVEPTPKIITHLWALDSFQFEDCGPSPSRLWNVMGVAGISLRHLVVDRMNNDLLDYLESFTGLEELSLQYPDSHDKDADKMAQRFYENVLPKHSPSLQKLLISPSYDGSWVIGLHNANVFNGCEKLHSLTVCLKPDDVQSKNRGFDVITHLLALPSLTDASFGSVFESSERSVRFSRCGTHTMSFRSRVAEGIKQTVQRIRLPKTSPARNLRVCVESSTRVHQFILSDVGDGSDMMEFRAS